MASFYGHTESAQLLINAGASVKCVNEVRQKSYINIKFKAFFWLQLKQTPLHNVGNITIARLILQAGADIDAQDGDQETVLHYEARKGRVEMLEMLLAAGADSYIVNKV